MPTDPFRVLLVDDSPAFLMAAVRLLSSLPGVELAGSAVTGREAIEKVERQRPDLVLMDIAMPEVDGLETTRRLTATGQAPPVVLMSLHDLEEYHAAAESAGACALIPKADLAMELLPLLRHLLLTRELSPCPAVS